MNRNENAGFNRVLSNHSLTGCMEFDFEGFGVAMTVRCGRLTPDFIWQMDDGEKKVFRLKDPGWAGDLLWKRSEVLWHGDKVEKHTVRIWPMTDEESTGKGSIFEIFDIGVLK